MRFFSCAAPLARFTAGLFALIVCFRAHCCVVACITIFISVFFHNCVFERWIILSFCKINWEISGAAFFAYWNDCILWHAWHVSCVILGWFVYYMLWFLSFHVQFRCHLIFWNTFVHCLIIFPGQMPHFCKFCRVLVCLGVTCSFFSISSYDILILFVLRDFYIRNFD